MQFICKLWSMTCMSIWEDRQRDNIELIWNGEWTFWAKPQFQRQNPIHLVPPPELVTISQKPAKYVDRLNLYRFRVVFTLTKCETLVRGCDNKTLKVFTREFYLLFDRFLYYSEKLFICSFSFLVRHFLRKTVPRYHFGGIFNQISHTCWLKVDFLWSQY